jgi:hypothetical protein
MTNSKVLMGLFVMAILTTSLIGQSAFATVSNITDLSATAVSGGNIDLTWSPSIPSASDSSVTYRIERSTDSFASVTTILVVSQAGTSYTDTSGVDTTTYQYRVMPIGDSSGDGSYSNLASATSDSSLPVITGSTTNITDGGNTELTATDQYVEFCTATDNDPTNPTCSVQSGSIDTSLLGFQSVTYEATDTVGNVGTATISTTVVDTTAPTFDVDGNTSDYSTNIVFNGVYTQGTIQNQDDISGIASSVIGGDTVDTSVVTTYFVTYTVTDNNGVSAVITETVNIGADTEKPVITPIGSSATIELESSNSYVEQGATVTDNDPNYSESVVVSGDIVDTSVVGSYTVLYNAPADANGNTPDQQSITIDVVDTTAPTFDVDGHTTDYSTILEVLDTYNVGTINNIVDLSLPTITSIVGDGAVDTSVPTVTPFLVTYTVTDDQGNSFTITESVSVVDTTIPIITLNGANPQFIALNGAYVELGATASDISDGDVTGSIVIDSSAVDTSTLGDYLVTYDVQDSSGNDAIQVTRTVTVTLGDAPVLTINGASGSIAYNAQFTTPSATCEDTEDGNIDGNIIVSGGVDYQSGDYTISYSCTDSSGNTIQDSIVITRLTHGGSHDKIYLSAPTYGKIIETENQFVTDGFSWKCGNSAMSTVTITDNFHTPFDMVNINTGDECTFKVKGYFSNGMAVGGLSFGVPETGKGQDAETRIDVYTDFGYKKDKKITDIDIVQKSQVIDESTLSVVHSIASCNPTDKYESCDVLEYSIKFLEPLQYKVMMIQGIDSVRLPTNTYLNEGFNVSGEQFTELPSVMIPSPTKYEGLIQVTQTEKYSNIWTADDGRLFERNNSGSFTWINQEFKVLEDTGSLTKRDDTRFGSLVDWTQSNAVKVFDSSKLQKSDKGYFAYAEGIDHREQTLQKLGWLD